jgi:tetratricopeptide (TPR) repeat protein
MIGRDKEKSKVLDTLLDKTPARIAILGAGGMGKTTLALSSLHDPAVIEHFPSRYFVSCEAVPSVSALVGEIANALCIPPAKRDEHLIDVILSSFHGNAVLCLDNFETIWDNETARLDVEGFLSHLNHLPQLAIIVTMRGTQRPSRVSWSKPLLPPLEKLSDANSKLIFETICGKVDVSVEKLLKAIDGIPLAVTLVSALLQEGNETSESLWARWEKTRTTVVENGGNDRLSNLDTSIHLSVYGPRMQADPNTISILAMLSVLPDGFPYAGGEWAIDELQHHLPGDYHLREALLTMRRVSLLNVDKAHTPHRFRMLAPIRHFCERRLETPELLRSGLTCFYTEMIDNFSDVTDSAGHAIIPAELGNMHAVFVATCKRRKGDNAVVGACIGYTKWSLYIGNPVEEVICVAMEVVVGSPSLLADCHSTLSDVYFLFARLDEAQASCERAVELHRQAHDVRGEANDVWKLGDVHLRRSKLDEAQASFECAVELHRRAHDVRGEANDVHKLGHVHLERNKLDEAQASFERAVELHRQAHYVIGEANDVQMLGNVHFLWGKLDEAQASFEHAVELHRQAHSVLGEANDVLMLGNVHLGRDKLDEAQASFEHAVELHRQAHEVIGEANDVHGLGNVHLQRNKLNEAQASFESATELHRQGRSVLGEANDVQMLGVVHLRQDKLDKAKESFEQALALYQQIQAIFGEANSCQSLGRLYLQQDNLQKAEQFLNHALLLHQQSLAPSHEATDLTLLQQLSVRKQQLPLT